MNGTRTRRRSSIRLGAVALALAALGVLFFALTPGAHAGLAGSNTLSVNPVGTGNGSIVGISGPGDPPINCTKTGSSVTGNCSAEVPFGAPPEPFVGLQANPAANAEFAGWQVSPANTPTFNCGLQATCYVQMNSDVTVTATFNSVAGFPVTVIRQGSAAQRGSVTSTPAGINCTPTDQVDCTHSVPAGSLLVLTASAPAGTTFGGWGPAGPNNACAPFGTNPVCTLSVTQPLYAQPVFNTQTFTLTASVTGDGGISSNIQPGISCGQGNSGTCSASFASTQQVVLTATADSGYNFAGWGGSCASSGTNPTCTVTVTAALSVSANFTAAAVQATVTGNRVVYSQRRPFRVLRITVSAQQDVNVRIQLQRGGTNWQSKRFNNVDEGTSVLTMNIRNGIPAGRYTAVVTFTNSQGAPPLVQNRNVKLKAVPR